MQQATKPVTPARATATYDDDPAFTEFWAVYPRKCGKQIAFKMWRKIIHHGVDPDLLITAAARMAAWPALPEKTYIPTPVTWLLQERWEDDLNERYPLLPLRRTFGEPS